MADERRSHPDDIREGDVLGVSDAAPDPKLPNLPRDKGGNPKGIDVRPGTHGASELERSKGATGIDMGGGGEGTDIKP